MEAAKVPNNNCMEDNTHLIIEAEVLLPILSYCALLHTEDKISSADFAGVFILSYLALRRPRSWSNGALKARISSSFSSSVLSVLPMSVNVSSIPGLLDILGRDYLMKKIGKGCDGITDVTVLSIFDQLQLSGIKKNTGDYVNRSIVCWAYDLSPFHLMFRIPSPLEVLLQQADGKRVITMFITKKELERKHIAMLYYMDGMQNHAKDSLEFLLHDMKHMEHFTDASIHNEQVGFFRCMLKLSSAFYGNLSEVDLHTVCKDKLIINNVEKCPLEKSHNDIVNANASFVSQSISYPALTLLAQGNSVTKRGETSVCVATETTLQNIPVPRKTSPRFFFLNICGFDKLLWHELEYVISDM